MADDTVLITGCGSGIGRETALAFRERGWNVCATDPDPDAMADLAERGCLTLELDVTEDGDATAVVERVAGEFGGIDCLFNNAGYGQIGPLEELPTDRLREQFEVNVFGQHRLLRAVLPVMRRRDGGTVVNMASVYGRTVFPGQGAYCASKWAVEAVTDTLRTEVADHGIDVVTIEPGPVETRFGERALARKEDLEPTGAYGWFYRLYDPELYDRRFIDRGVGYVQPRRVAAVVVDAATDDDPDRRYVVGPWKYPLLLGVVVPDAARDLLYGLLKRFA
ncbi:SDR family oxidoreductase [Halomarina pelagica]|uniref:SDR family oxidoreductase n=1 Tax=Halomarina pelagica TaxID=2961599 RepID=UPI0020C41375|nr:SDR family oxidoreductase [Halomarina sp. BND7]